MAASDTREIKEANNWEREGRQSRALAPSPSDIYRKYNANILYTLYFHVLQIAAEVSAPLAKTDEIVLIGGQDRTAAEVRT